MQAPDKGWSWGRDFYAQGDPTPAVEGAYPCNLSLCGSLLWALPASSPSFQIGNFIWNNRDWCRLVDCGWVTMVTMGSQWVTVDTISAGDGLPPGTRASRHPISTTQGKSSTNKNDNHGNNKKRCYPGFVKVFFNPVTPKFKKYVLPNCISEVVRIW